MNRLVNLAILASGVAFVLNEQPLAVCLLVVALLVHVLTHDPEA